MGRTAHREHHNIIVEWKNITNFNSGQETHPNNTTSHIILGMITSWGKAKRRQLRVNSATRSLAMEHFFVGLGLETQENSYLKFTALSEFGT